MNESTLEAGAILGQVRKILDNQSTASARLDWIREAVGPGDLLSEDEWEAMTHLARFAGVMRRISVRDEDWSEACHDIHVLQSRVMAQAAARAYPDKFRLLSAPIPETSA